MGKSTESPNAEGKALITAACQGNFEEVKTLLQKDIPVDTMDEENRTALFYAAQRGFIDIAELLLSQGANKNHKDKFGLTPLVFMNEISDDIVTFRNQPFASAEGKKKIRALLTEKKLELT